MTCACQLLGLLSLIQIQCSFLSEPSLAIPFLNNHRLPQFHEHAWSVQYMRYTAWHIAISQLPYYFKKLSHMLRRYYMFQQIFVIFSNHMITLRPEAIFLQLNEEWIN